MRPLIAGTFVPQGSYEEGIELRMSEIVDCGLWIVVQEQALFQRGSAGVSPALSRILRDTLVTGRALRPRGADSLKNVSTPRQHKHSKESVRLCGCCHGFIAMAYGMRIRTRSGSAVMI